MFFTGVLVLILIKTTIMIYYNETNNNGDVIKK